MFTDQQMTLANIRFLARGGETPEFYDLLTARLLETAAQWPALCLTDDESLILARYRARLLCELAYLRSMASLGSSAIAAI